MSDLNSLEALRTVERRNPVTGEVATTVPAASVADANAACDAAAAAFPAWSAMGPNARRAILNKAAAELEARVQIKISEGVLVLQRRRGGQAAEGWWRRS